MFNVTNAITIATSSTQEIRAPRKLQLQTMAGGNGVFIIWFMSWKEYFQEKKTSKSVRQEMRHY